MAKANMLNTATNDITANTVRIGLGAGANATSTMVASGTTGTYAGAGNTVIGYQAGKSITTAVNQTLVGSQAGSSVLTIANGFVLIGYQAGNAALTGATVAIGSGAGSTITTPGTVCGFNAGQNNAGSPVAFGDSCLATNSGTNNAGFGSLCLTAATGGNNVGFGFQSLSTLTGGSYMVGIGSGTGGAGASGSVAVTTATACMLLGYQAGVNNAAAIGTISIGAQAVSDIATGTTSGTNGPGIAIGSAAYPVGFRGDASLYPTASVGLGTLPLTFTGYWRVKINGTYYKIPLYLD